MGQHLVHLVIAGHCWSLGVSWWQWDEVVGIGGSWWQLVACVPLGLGAPGQPTGAVGLWGGHGVQWGPLVGGQGGGPGAGRQWGGLWGAGGNKHSLPLCAHMFVGFDTNDEHQAHQEEC